MINNYNAIVPDISKPINKFKMFIFCTVLMVLFGLRDLFFFEIPTYVFVLYGIFAFIILNRNEIFAYLLFYIPFSNGASLSCVIGYGMLFYLLKCGGIIFNIRLFATSLILLAYEMLHFLIPPFSLISYLQFVIAILFILIAVSKYGELRTNEIIKYYIYGILLVCSMILFISLKYYHFDMRQFLSSGLRFGSVSPIIEGEAVLSNNENMIALYSIVGLSILFMMIVNRNINLYRGVILFIALSLFGLMTLSKTFMLVFIGGLLYVVLYYMFVKYKVTKAFFIVFITLTICLLIYIIVPDVINSLFYRFSVGDLSSGRIALIIEYLDVFTENVANFVFGIGMQSMVTKTGIHNYNHNSIVEVLSGWGLLGLLIVICYFVLIIKAVKEKQKNVTLLTFFPLVIYLVFTQSIQLFSVRELLVNIVPVFFSLLMTTKQNSEKNINDYIVAKSKLIKSEV